MTTPAGAPGGPPTLPIEWAVAARALQGEELSGDGHVVRPHAEGVLVAVVDGLGHGHQAAHATRKAVETLEAHAGESVIALMDRCHDALRSTRGAALSLASFSVRDSGMSWLGVGNVEGVLLRGRTTNRHRMESLILRGGVVGIQVPALHGSLVQIHRGDMLIFATDGIRYGFEQGVLAASPVQQTADRILKSHTRGTDDALVLVVRYLGPPP